MCLFGNLRQDAFHDIFLAARMQPRDNPIGGLSEDEATFYLLSYVTLSQSPVLDYLKRMAHLQLEVEEFDGVSIDVIPENFKKRYDAMV